MIFLGSILFLLIAFNCIFVPCMLSRLVEKLEELTHAVEHLDKTYKEF